MKINKKYIKRILIFSAIIIFIFISGTYIYLTKAAYWKIDKNDRDMFISQIKSAPTLPERFYIIYNKIYPGSLENGQLHYLLNRDDTDSECPCRLAAYNTHFTFLSDIHLVQLTFFVEDYLTQKECLNCLAYNFNFLNGIKGIENASKYFYNKDLSELSDSEIIELIVMMENPALYNKKRNSERLEKRVTKYGQHQIINIQ